MPLLQHPVKCLDQIEWFLDSRESELFPGAFLTSAGNLARQLLELMAFILAFYSRMPQSRYLTSAHQLRPLDTLLKALRGTDPGTGLTYLQLAAGRGSRIRKLTGLSRSFDRWRRLLNEPSHFVNPARNRRTSEKHLREFTHKLRSVLEDADGHLVVAAVNEINSNGFLKAVLGKEPENIPGVEQLVVVTPEMFTYKDGTFRMAHKVPHVIVSKSEELPYRRRRHMVFVQDSGGMAMVMRYVTRRGQTVNLNDLQAVFQEFVNDPGEREVFIRRMRRFGLTVHLETHP